MSNDKKKEQDKRRLITPPFRVAFPAVFEPKAFEDQEPKYSIVMLFDKKKTDISAMENAVLKVAQERWGKDEKKWPKSVRFKWPFKDGDEKEDLQGYPGNTYCTATSKQRPGVIDKDKSPITKEDETFYPGCFARAELVIFTYPKEGQKSSVAPGITFALQNVQKLKDGDPFTGRRKAEDVFDSVEDASEDEDNYESDSDSDDDEDMGF